MADNLEITLPSNWQIKWPQIQESARKYGFKLQKQGNNIAVSGPKIEGEIAVEGDRGQVRIAKKPFFVSNNMIVGKIREFLQSFT